MEELKTKFAAVEVVATLQCGGNRRLEMSAKEKTNGKVSMLFNLPLSVVLNFSQSSFVIVEVTGLDKQSLTYPTCTNDATGSNWNSAISTARWRGARLRDVLLAAGVKEEDVYAGMCIIGSLQHQVIMFW